MIKKYIIFTIILVSAFTIGGFFAFNYFSSISVSITVPNSSEISVKNDKNIIASTKGTVLKFRAPKNTSLNVSFFGTGNFEMSSRTVQVGTTAIDTTIKPYYSQAHLRSILPSQENNIKLAIKSYNPSLENSYTISNLKLYHYGDWASATLVWKGNPDDDNSDTLSIILRKDNNNWNILGQPSILFFNGTKSTIPLDILESVNNSYS